MNLPRALRSPVMAMARPQRPPVERKAVLDAAAIVRGETGWTASDPVAAIIAARVVTEMQAYWREQPDPFLAALGAARRKASACPFGTLATHGDTDTLSLFVEARVERLRSREGHWLSERDDETECSEIWRDVQGKLWKRYLRAMLG